MNDNRLALLDHQKGLGAVPEREWSGMRRHARIIEMTDADRLRAALDLHQFGKAMMRECLRREHPEKGDVEIDDLLRRWLEERPGAEQGDGDGRPVSWPRRR